MTFPRQRDLDKIGDNQQLGRLTRVDPRQHRHNAIGRARRPASGNVILAQDALGHLRKREERQSAAHVAARIAIL